jgi:hypothetical protein
VTVLPHEEQVALVVQREDDNRANMFNDVKPGFVTVRQAQAVTPDAERAPSVCGFGFQEFEWHGCPPK